MRKLYLTLAALVITAPPGVCYADAAERAKAAERIGMWIGILIVVVIVVVVAVKKGLK